MINFAHNSFLKISGLIVVVSAFLEVLLIIFSSDISMQYMGLVGSLFLWIIMTVIPIISFCLSIGGIIISGLRIRGLDNVDKIFAVIFVLFVLTFFIYHASL